MLIGLIPQIQLLVIKFGVRPNALHFLLVIVLDHLALRKYVNELVRFDQLKQKVHRRLVYAGTFVGERRRGG